MPRVLDGAAIAEAIKREVAGEVNKLRLHGIRPGLAAVLVGHVSASEIYVRNKVAACAELGLHSESITPPESVPCTPAGVIEILDRSGITIEGRHAVVVGRSDIVGKPAAMLLLNRNATVTICHSKTQNLGEVTRDADILVAAIGRPGFITPEMVKPGATLIDVGINRLNTREEFDRFFKGNAKREAAFEKRGSVIVGDIHPAAFDLSGAYTPVPGGVGLLTIAMLMANTVKAAKMRRGIE